jgi:hypothetical protein
MSTRNIRKPPPAVLNCCVRKWQLGTGHGAYMLLSVISGLCFLTVDASPTFMCCVTLATPCSCSCQTYYRLTACLMYNYHPKQHDSGILALTSVLWMLSILLPCRINLFLPSPSLHRVLCFTWHGTLGDASINVLLLPANSDHRNRYLLWALTQRSRSGHSSLVGGPTPSLTRFSSSRGHSVQVIRAVPH